MRLRGALGAFAPTVCDAADAAPDATRVGGDFGTLVLAVCAAALAPDERRDFGAGIGDVPPARGANRTAISALLSGAPFESGMLCHFPSRCSCGATHDKASSAALATVYGNVTPLRLVVAAGAARYGQLRRNRHRGRGGNRRQPLAFDILALADHTPAKCGAEIVDIVALERE